MASPLLPVVIVGAGPAGLATSFELKRRNIDHVVLERGENAGTTWANLYDSLRLHTGKHMSALPGKPFPRTSPMFISRADFVRYLGEYARGFDLPIKCGETVRAARHDGVSWIIETDSGRVESESLVIASGIVAQPRVPEIAGRERFKGTLLHSIEYRRPAPFAGKRVLVVGVGNSGAEIASELGRSGLDVTLAVRSGANVVPLQMLGIPIQYLSYLIRKLPFPLRKGIVAGMSRMTELRRGRSPLPKPAHGPLEAIPVIGFHLVDAIGEGLVKLRGGIEELTEDGARFLDGVEERYDAIILATGFQPALKILGDQVHLDPKGFAIRKDRVESADQPNLYFVGHNYDATGGLFNIRIDSGLVAEKIAALRRE